jgi:hypothetical protein
MVHANSIVAITGIGITDVPVVAIRCEPIPVIIERTPIPIWPGEKRALTAKDWSWDKWALTAEDRPGDNWALTAKNWSGKERALTAIPAPAIPALRNSVRWFHDCQRGHRSEKCGALQHDSLLYRLAPPHLTPYSPIYVTASVSSDVGKRG